MKNYAIYIRTETKEEADILVNIAILFNLGWGRSDKRVGIYNFSEKKYLMLLWDIADVKKFSYTINVSEGFKRVLKIEVNGGAGDRWE